MKYPKDRFDDIPSSLDRRGAHRAPRTRGDRIAAWLWGAGAVIVLVVIGLIAMFAIDNIVSFEQAEPTPTPTEEIPAEAPPAAVTPALDPELPVTVLNGTALAGVAGGTGDDLEALGWNVVSRDDADNENYTETTVFYGAAEDEAAALQVVQDLGGGTAVLDPSGSTPGTITIIIGLDLAE